jgi:hypothetical protein
MKQRSLRSIAMALTLVCTLIFGFPMQAGAAEDITVPESERTIIKEFQGGYLGGACIDNDGNVYYAKFRYPTNKRYNQYSYNEVSIVKWNLNGNNKEVKIYTWDKDKKESKYNLYHANGMTYIPESNSLAIATLGGSKTNVVFFSLSKNKPIAETTTKNQVGAIAYNAKYGTIVGGISDRFTVFNYNKAKHTLSVKANEIKKNNSGYNGQDICVSADGEYIYSILTKNGKNNIVSVTDKSSGDEVKKVTLAGTESLEGESLFVYGGTLYVMFKDITGEQDAPSNISGNYNYGYNRTITLQSMPLSYFE